MREIAQLAECRGEKGIVREKPLALIVTENAVRTAPNARETELRSAGFPGDIVGIIWHEGSVGADHYQFERDAKLGHGSTVASVQEKKVRTLQGVTCVEHAGEELVGLFGITHRLDSVAPKAVEQCKPMPIMVRHPDRHIVRQMSDAGPCLFIDRVCRCDVLTFAEREFKRFELVSDSAEI